MDNKETNKNKDKKRTLLMAALIFSFGALVTTAIVVPIALSSSNNDKPINDLTEQEKVDHDKRIFVVANQTTTPKLIIDLDSALTPTTRETTFIKLTQTVASKIGLTIPNLDYGSTIEYKLVNTSREVGQKATYSFIARAKLNSTYSTTDFSATLTSSDDVPAVEPTEQDKVNMDKSEFETSNSTTTPKLISEIDQALTSDSMSFTTLTPMISAKIGVTLPTLTYDSLIEYSLVNSTRISGQKATYSFIARAKLNSTYSTTNFSAILTSSDDVEPTDQEKADAEISKVTVLNLGEITIQGTIPTIEELRPLIKALNSSVDETKLILFGTPTTTNATVKAQFSTAQSTNSATLIYTIKPLSEWDQFLLLPIQSDNVFEGNLTERQEEIFMRLTGDTNETFKSFYDELEIVNEVTSITLPSVTKLFPKAFKTASLLTTMNIPSVTTIELNSFSTLTLTSLNISSLTAIPKIAFKNSPLTLLDATAAVTIGDEAFRFAVLETLELPNVITIGWASFVNCPLTSIDLPKVQTLGAAAFTNAKLTSLTLPEAITIGNSAFMNSVITTLELPLAQTVGNTAFQFSKLTTLDLPNAISIGDSSFTRSLLTSLSIPNVTTIGVGAFTSSKLTSLVLDKVTSVGDYAFRYSVLTDLDAPLLETIGTSAFDSARLTTLDLPCTTTIGANAFNFSEFTYINLPLVTSIGLRAFANTQNFASTIVNVNVAMESIADWKDIAFGSALKHTEITFNYIG